MRPTSPSRSSSRSTVTLQELPTPEPTEPSSHAPLAHDQVVFVTNAVRRRGGLRTRSETHRPVLAAVVR